MGGRKTIGTIYKEAVAMLKAEYFHSVGISGLVVGVSMIMSSVVYFFAIVLYIFLLIGLEIPFMMLPIFALSSTSGGSSIAPGIIGVLGFMLIVLLVALVLFFFFTLVSAAVSIVVGTVQVSAQEATLLLLKGDRPSWKAVWGSFRKNWKRYLGVTAWMFLWTFLWSLLFYVPGIIKSLSYSMTPFLVIQYPEMTVRQAMKKSMEMTEGHKGTLFLIVLIMSGFLYVASIVSCGFYIAIFAMMLLWAVPLYLSMMSIAYLDLKQAAIEKGILSVDTEEPGEKAEEEAK